MGWIHAALSLCFEFAIELECLRFQKMDSHRRMFHPSIVFAMLIRLRGPAIGCCFGIKVQYCEVG
jgi:hypothetical protein